MQNTFSLLFYPKGNDKDKDGLVPLYLRITVNGKRSELSIKRKIHRSKWNTEAGKLRGTTTEVRAFNRHLDNIKDSIYKIYEKQLEERREITSEIIKNIFLGKTQKPKMLLKIFKDHNNQVQKLIGKDFARGTAIRYATARKHVEEYIQNEYQLSDIPIKLVDHSFITRFEYYLKSKRNCSHNTTLKYINNFKKIVRIAFANEWIDKDPFLNWKAKFKIVDREFLTEQEIQDIISKKLHAKRLDQVKDIFLFCCFTGLAYADVKKLSQDDLVLGIDGETWIKINRTKTNSISNLPVNLQTKVDRFSQIVK